MAPPSGERHADRGRDPGLGGADGAGDDAALTAGLALVPLVLAGGDPGNEILSPMGEVILGGLLSSTALNLVVVPALFARWGLSRAGNTTGRSAEA